MVDIDLNNQKVLVDDLKNMEEEYHYWSRYHAILLLILRIYLSNSLERVTWTVVSLQAEASPLLPP